MREFFQSCTTLAFSLSLLGLELTDEITSMDSGRVRTAATRAVDAVSNAAAGQLGPRLGATFRSLNDVQRGMAGMMFDFSLAFARNTLDWLGDDRGGVHRSGPYKVESRSEDGDWAPVN